MVHNPRPARVCGFRCLLQLSHTARQLAPDVSLAAGCDRDGGLCRGSISFRKCSLGVSMRQRATSFLLAALLLCFPYVHATAAEREDVRKVINLVTSVKMPFPENLARNRAKTERVWLERDGATVGCIRL